MSREAREGSEGKDFSPSLLFHLFHSIRLILLFLHLFHQFLHLDILCVFHLLVLRLAACDKYKHSRSQAD
jgi:hypothetical protein